jgi:hypothetical protein
MNFLSSEAFNPSKIYRYKLPLIMFHLLNPAFWGFLHDYQPPSVQTPSSSVRQLVPIVQKLRRASRTQFGVLARR